MSEKQSSTLQSMIAPRASLRRIYWSVSSASIAIWALAELVPMLTIGLNTSLMIGAFGASAVLLFSAPQSPFAQPYNVMVGHVLSALIGVAAFKAIGDVNGLSIALAVSLSIGAMQLTHSIHPPGGATALIAVIGSPEIHALGFQYAISPVGIGAGVLVVVAFMTNNLGRGNRWPVYWLPYRIPLMPRLGRGMD